VVPTRAEFTLSYDGLLQASAPGRAPRDFSYNLGGDIRYGFQAGQTIFNRTLSTNLDTLPQLRVADGRTFSVLIFPGQTRLAFTYFLEASASVFAGPDFAGAITGSASSDFNSTAKITGLVFRDAAGRDITVR
jgi:hypothetical protein